MHDDNEPIAALATPHGPGGVAVIRASGRDVLSKLAAVIDGDVELRARIATPVRIRFADGAPAIDARALAYSAGASYTSEESVELFLPSSPPVLRSLLEQLRRAGIRAAEPGEFTRRAFLSGRIDLTRAEAVVQVIAAEDLESARAARRVLDGDLAREIERLGDSIHNLIALLEAGLDFSEQEVEPPAAAWLLTQARDILAHLDRLCRNPVSAHRSTARVRVVLWGRANAGKSTCFNALLGRDSAITSPQAGTTRDPVGAELVRDGWPTVELLDLPGAHDAADRSEKAAIALAAKDLEDADLILYLVDASRSVASITREWGSLPDGIKARAWLVLSKADLTAARPSLDGVGAPPTQLALSATTPGGRQELEMALASHLTRGRWDARGAAYLFTDRQRSKLTEARAALREVADDLSRRDASAEPVQPELLSIDLRDVHGSLEEITGALSTEETLDKIFSQFCLGK